MICKKCIFYEKGCISKTGCVIFDRCEKKIADLSKVKIEECIEKREK